MRFVVVYEFRVFVFSLSNSSWVSTPASNSSLSSLSLLALEEKLSLPAWDSLLATGAVCIAWGIGGWYAGCCGAWYMGCCGALYAGCW